MTADEWDRCRAARKPTDVAVPDTSVRQWRLIGCGCCRAARPAVEAERNQSWFAVAFHLRVLLRQYAFADVDLLRQLRDAEAKRNPPREILPTPR